MLTPLAACMEPIPGYTLVEPLGQGGFGEVWKAEAPGGIPKAIKFVKGSLNDADGKVPAAQELKALNRVKEVHHPFILGIERVDIVEGQLIIVMELADRDIHHRLQECLERGLPGIPREELLRYMQEAAEALDLMNIEYQLQHLDIKPQNLFLVHNHVKVADFGLVKDLEGMTATITSGITPVYAAPETFEGRVSRFSDQYSLAIVYQELLTGVRPFNGKNGRALLVQHVSQAPDLSSLPEPDRAIVGRALSKKPTERFATCGEFVTALRKGAAGPVPPAAARTASASLTPAALRTQIAADQNKESAVAAQLRKRVSPFEKVYEKPEKPKNGKGDTVEIASSSKEPTVRIEKTKEKEKAALTPKAEEVPCPQCGAAIIDPGRNAWCGACGYCGDTAARALLMSRDLAAWNVVSWTRVVLGGLGVAATLAVLGLMCSIASAEFLSTMPLLIGLVATLVALCAVYGSHSGVAPTKGRTKVKKKSRKETGLIPRKPQ